MCYNGNELEQRLVNLILLCYKNFSYFTWGSVHGSGSVEEVGAIRGTVVNWTGEFSGAMREVRAVLWMV